MNKPIQMPNSIPATANPPAGENVGSERSSCESLPPNAKAPPTPIKLPAMICNNHCCHLDFISSNLLVYQAAKNMPKSKDINKK